ncbi:MAG TPA: ABC transporter permease [Chitinophaga sp.]|uniref:ABC transporter permease n=1 Tax=Chitinophaga sp. TaxID=1869181 RepID=UPI002DBEDB55|nr:ABC transporter permease [Chitinophaga sp.]HEU4551371.1 ABC transporter permease [Chitinophaga sp.]
MFKNYLKIAWRNLWKQKVFTLINVGGLTIGLTVGLLLLLWVQNELNFDRYNKNVDRIYRVTTNIHVNNSNFISSTVPDPMGPTMVSEYPQVENMVRLLTARDIMVNKGHETLWEKNGTWADSTLFDVFTLPFIAGNPKTALTTPYSVVISERAARKYFQSTDVVGKILHINNTADYRVTGVMKNIPDASHFHFDFIMSMAEIADSRGNDWLNNNYFTYLLVRPGTTRASLSASVKAVVRKYLGARYQELLHINLDELEKQGNYVHYDVMPLADIHLYADKADQTAIEPGGDVQYVYIFSAAGIFILLIACINFMNLSTARSASRAKEVGVRKTLGSLRKQLIMQFLAESWLICSMAMALALLAVALLLPFFNQLAGRDMNIRLLYTPRIITYFLLLLLAVGMLAGAYPAFFLSGFKPLQVLKGKLAAGSNTKSIRSGLVVLQFVISSVLIIGTFVIYNQLHYIQHRQIGYNRQQVLVLQNTYPLYKQVRAFREAVLKLPGVEDGTMTGFLPTGQFRNSPSFFKDRNADVTTAFTTETWSVDEHYIPTLGMRMVSGRNFDPEHFASDSTGIIVNETAARLLGFKDPLDKLLYHPINDNVRTLQAYHIIGVVKDFNYNSMHQAITPLFLWLDEQRGSMAFRIKTGDIPALVAQVKKQWDAMVPGQPFLYSFMDDDFNAIYRADQRTGNVFIWFAALAIVVACLGLSGLAVFTAEQRTKEIGIRKVHGASVADIVSLLSRDFIKLVLVAIVIATPVAWYIMNSWLQDFAYRTAIPWWVFLLSGSIAVLIALFTVSFQSIKAALMNPVKSLRTE